MAKKNNSMILDPYFEGLLLEKIPHLGDIFVAEGVDIEKALRYLSLAYDPNSPLIVDYPDIAKRRLRSAAIVGIKVKEVPGVFIPLFLKNVVKSMDWTFISSLENAFDEFSEIINDKIKRDGSDDEILKATKEGKAVEGNEGFEGGDKDTEAGLL